ncbi:MAG TPA: DUF167 domain-containing protein [Phycisphaerales bacterium]|nr:DUF167 domain-containing protein [Phycisphaerales bacterium]
MSQPVTIRIKAVPGSRKDQIAGMLGDRLKIRVAAPPEDGRANAAICRTLADALGLKERDVEILSGHAHPEKTIAIRGLAPDEVRRRLGLP